ncbi:hypothetical protein NDQ71_04650 [Pseudoalteromonas sp. KG3]|uniref:hypothetical protein n=1 Tax=Pseudoalteromonas sp. KG3 TaxID=2951137 RepID=UPI002657E29C|nr:hypothetical protein [Pseudoalteromonas sp. KG3]WKD24379.1 hypothetical protein NDQ71_04650 [Pseudoalteromonas sp. KG3]
MMLRVIFILIFSIFITGCDHYNYAVKKNDSPIIYDLYGKSPEEYEFYSNLYKVNPENIYSDMIEITHLNDVYNSQYGTPESTTRKSRLDFVLHPRTGVELVVPSVRLEHYSEKGDLYKPIKIESTLSKCVGNVGCNGIFVLHYADKMPQKIIEKVSFKIIVNGKEKHVSYIIPLELKFEYSFWDGLMNEIERF